MLINFLEKASHILSRTHARVLITSDWSANIF